jgi:protein-S-isoprenylcysteine O-methyltransferase Ste14
MHPEGSQHDVVSDPVTDPPKGDYPMEAVVGTHKVEERGPVAFPPPLIYVSGLFAAFALEAVVPSPDVPRAVAVVLIVGVVAAVILLDARAAALFRKSRTGIAPWHPTTQLVTHGPYRISRNPMYLGMALAYTGLVVALGLLWGLALLPLVVVVMDRAVIRREEAYLEMKYGDDYLRYKNSVRRWL